MKVGCNCGVCGEATARTFKASRIFSRGGTAE
jgi:hypothetical protein